MSTDVNGRQGSGGTYSGEEPVDLGRYLVALRRSRWLIAAIVAIITAAVLALSLTLPKHYVASASVDKPAPGWNSEVTVSGRLMRGGQGVGGATMTTPSTFWVSRSPTAAEIASGETAARWATVA